MASFLPAFSSPPVFVVSAVASEVAEPAAAPLEEACVPEDARSVEALAVRQVRSETAQDDSSRAGPVRGDCWVVRLGAGFPAEADWVPRQEDGLFQAGYSAARQADGSVLLRAVCSLAGWLLTDDCSAEAD